MKVEPKHLFSYLWGYSLINSLKVVILLFLRPWIQEKDYVLIRKDKSKPDDHCKSVLGKKSGPNEMVLNPNCFDYHSVMHQFFHSLGFAHENQRRDYYKYITSQ